MKSDEIVWTITLPCVRSDIDRIDAATELLFADRTDAPIFTFVEQEGGDVEDGTADEWLLQIYCDHEPDPALLASVAALLPDAGIAPKVEQLVPQDWVALSQSGMPPITTTRFHVRNGADEPPAPGFVNFLIPASRAFGTGQHETTHGCLHMLERLREAGHRFGNIADIGTGTGLLAFAALALWPRAHVAASDIDPTAVEVTAENAALNGIVEGSGPGALTLVEAAGMDHATLADRAPYDLVIANILAGPLVALAPAFAAHLADGGSLIVAGLLDGQADAVIAACQRAGLRLAERSDRGQWPTLHLRKRRRFGWRRPERWGDSADSVAPGFGSL